MLKPLKEGAAKLATPSLCSTIVGAKANIRLCSTIVGAKGVVRYPGLHSTIVGAKKRRIKLGRNLAKLEV